MITSIHSHRRLVLLIVSLAISIVTIIALFSLTTTLETYNILAEIRPVYLLFAIGMHFGAWIIWSSRLKLMSEFVGGEKDLKLLKALKITLASYFAACITPSQFGGEPVRIYLLNKNGLTVGDGTAVVFGERALDVVVVTIGAAVSFLLFRTVLSQNIILCTIFTFIGACLCAGIAVIIYGLAKPEKGKKFIDFLFSKLKLKYRRLEEMKEKVGHELDNFYNALRRFQCEGKVTIGLALLFTLAFWLAEFAIPSLILLGFGADPVWMYSIAAQFILLIIVAVPTTPGSSGVAEVSLASLYSALVAAPLLGVFTVLWRLIIYYTNLVTGGLVSLKILGEMS